MRTFQQYLGEREEQPTNSRRRNTLDATLKNQSWFGNFHSEQVFKSPGHNKMYVVSKTPQLRLDGGEWWAVFDEVKWDGISLKSTGSKGKFPLDPHSLEIIDLDQTT